MVAVVAGISHAPSAQIAPNGQPSFRVRSDFSVPLNADQGWAAPVNADVTIQADRPFRLRLERPDGAKVYGYIYDAGSNGGAGMNRFGEVVLAGR